MGYEDGGLPDLPLKYKTARFMNRHEKLTIKTVPLDYPRGDELLVKVLACGLCYADVLTQTSLPQCNYPMTPGHEIIGDVVVRGPGVQRYRIGDRVGSIWHGGHDGMCRFCANGDFIMCTHPSINGNTRNGGYAEYVLLKVNAAISLNRSVDPITTIPFLCAGAAPFKAIRDMNVPAGRLIAVQGIGGLGHMALQYAKAMGYETCGISSREWKREFVLKELGADHFIRCRRDVNGDNDPPDARAAAKRDGEDVGARLQELGGADCIVMTAPNTQRNMAALLDGLAPRGKLVVITQVGVDDLAVDISQVVRRGLTITGWPGGKAWESLEAIQFAQKHGIKPKVQTYKFADANKAFDDLVANRIFGRGVLVP